MKHIVLVENEYGDWEGLYIDDELVIEKHKLSSKDICQSLELIGIDFRSMELTESQMEKLKYSLPKDFKCINDMVEDEEEQ